MRILAFILLTMLALGLGRTHLMAADLDEGGVGMSIGLLLPPEESEAESLRRGLELGLEQAHPRTGLKVSLQVRGRAGQWGDDGEEAARMVLDDGVCALVAPPGGAPSHLALQVAGRTATPVLTLCPDSSVTGAGVPWMARLAPSTEEEARLLFAAYAPDPGEGCFRWFALVPDGRAGREAGKDLARAQVGTGSELDRVLTVSGNPEAMTFVLDGLRSAKPDGVMVWLDPGLAGSMVSMLRSAGFSGRIAGPGRLESEMFLEAAGRAAEGVIVARPVMDTESEEVAVQFRAEYGRRFEVEPDRTARLAYDAARLLVELIREGGNRPLRVAFPFGGVMPGASGRLEFDRRGNRISRLELSRWEGGQWKGLVEGKRIQAKR